MDVYHWTDINAYQHLYVLLDIQTNQNWKPSNISICCLSTTNLIIEKLHDEYNSDLWVCIPGYCYQGRIDRIKVLC